MLLTKIWFNDNMNESFQVISHALFFFFLLMEYNCQPWTSRHTSSMRTHSSHWEGLVILQLTHCSCETKNNQMKCIMKENHELSRNNTLTNMVTHHWSGPTSLLNASLVAHVGVSVSFCVRSTGRRFPWKFQGDNWDLFPGDYHSGGVRIKATESCQPRREGMPAFGNLSKIKRSLGLPPHGS